MCNDPNLLFENKININLLKELSAKPELFAPVYNKFWDDPHISKQMLNYHLDPNEHLASRQPETIDHTVEWLCSHLKLEKGMEVADLGCGPGLYTTRLHEKGLRVTGIDFSRNSINYAQNTAAKLDYDINYICQNYLELDYQDKFDLIILIYFDFGVLSFKDQKLLLSKVYRALKPGGYFAFDVTTPLMRKGSNGKRNWEITHQGFWSPTPYVMLYQLFHYPEVNVYLDQYLIVDQDGRVKTYRIWQNDYTPESISLLLDEAGVPITEIWSDLLGNHWTEETVSLGVIAKKE